MRRLIKLTKEGTSGPTTRDGGRGETRDEKSLNDVHVKSDKWVKPLLGAEVRKGY